MNDFHFKLNGDFVVCSKHDEQAATSSIDGVLLYNKVEEGFQKLNKFTIEQIVFKNQVDFPFSVGDIVIVASSGTVVNWRNKKFWLFKPEHVLAKVKEGERNV